MKQWNWQSRLGKYQQPKVLPVAYVTPWVGWNETDVCQDICWQHGLRFFHLQNSNHHLLGGSNPASLPLRYPASRKKNATEGHQFQPSPYTQLPSFKSTTKFAIFLFDIHCKPGKARSSSWWKIKKTLSVFRPHWFTLNIQPIGHWVITCDSPFVPTHSTRPYGKTSKNSF